MDSPPFHKLYEDKLQQRMTRSNHITRMGRPGGGQTMSTSGALHAETFLQRLAPQDDTVTLRSRSAFIITDTELNVIATLAMIGLRRMPKNG